MRVARLGIYLVRSLLGSRINHPFARLQSRITVSDTFSTSAVSWTSDSAARAWSTRIHYISRAISHEVREIVTLHALHIHEPHARLVTECRCLQGAACSLGRHAARRVAVPCTSR